MDLILEHTNPFVGTLGVFVMGIVGSEEFGCARC